MRKSGDLIMRKSHRFKLGIESLIKIFYRKHVDYVNSFYIEGRVIDALSGQPIQAVKVIFIDKSLDDRRRSDPEKSPVLLIESLADGSFKKKFKYIWSRDIAFLKIPRFGKDFSLRFEKKDYLTTSISFDLDTLKVIDGVIQVKIEKPITLQKSS